MDLGQSAAIIARARAEFNNDLFAVNYNALHYDEEHLKILLTLFEARRGENYLDLGTGLGYLAFAFHERFPGIRIVGLDIADKAIERNNQVVFEKGLSHIRFDWYDGGFLPYPDRYFQGAMSRYAFHPIPHPELCIDELTRIMKPGGVFLYSDATILPDDRDTHFVDQYMALKDDGHVRFYTPEELDSLFVSKGFIRDNCVYSSVTFPRPIDEHYDDLISRCPASVLNAYGVRIEKGDIFVTLPVINEVWRLKDDPYQF